MKKKINIELYKILYDEGLSIKEIATFFNVSMSRVYEIKSNLKLKRDVICSDCGKVFKTGHAGRFRCRMCGEIVEEQYHLRKIFGRLCTSNPRLAKEFEQEMIDEEGKNFRDFALNGFKVGYKKRG